MKLLTIVLILSSITAWSKTAVKNFNTVLMEGVQNDIKDENNDNLRTKQVSRGPASVESEPEGKFIQQEKKIDKNVQQLGGQKW